MVYLIDASVYVFRAYYSLPPDMRDGEGNPVHALYGFSRFLGDLLERARPDYVAVAFDESLATSFRNRIYPAYKANREPAPPDLALQFERCREVCAHLGVAWYASPEYEADDIIGTLATRAQADGVPVTIVSRDKDLTQLLTRIDCYWDAIGDVSYGYNDIEKVSSRRRAACLAHVRRYFFESLKTAPVAQEALDLITELYRVEHDAKEQRLSEAAHLAFRKQRAGPIRQRFKAWLDAQRSRHPPKSPLGVAIRYTLGQWAELGVFLDDARVPLDNNASERSLRRIALGRKNYLFVGDVASGKSLAGLYSLVATCESREINPFDYLADVLARVQDHPANAIDELLPGAWAAAR